MGRRRVRVGDCRVIYAIEEDEVLVLVVSVKHRRMIHGQARRRE